MFLVVLLLRMRIKLYQQIKFLSIKITIAMLDLQTYLDINFY